MTLARHQFTVQDQAGNIVAGAHVEIRSEIPGQPLAALYSDRAGTVGIGNPVDADSNGYVYFHVGGGFYKIRVYTGTSGAPTTEHIDRYVGIGLSMGTDTYGFSQRVVTAAGIVTVVSDDANIIVINKTVAAATTVKLPASAGMSAVRIADGKYDAATNNITVIPNRPNTFTVTIASPGVLTKVAHGLALNGPVSIETTGALPTGLLPNTQYYVKTIPTADTFTLSATPGGSVINTTGSQSGVHTYGTDTIMGGASYVIDSNGASILLTPLADGSGWI